MTETQALEELTSLTLQELSDHGRKRCCDGQSAGLDSDRDSDSNGNLRPNSHRAGKCSFCSVHADHIVADGVADDLIRRQ